MKEGTKKEEGRGGKEGKGGERKDEHLKGKEGGGGIRERKLSKSEIPEDSSEFFFFFHVCNKTVISILDHTKPILYHEARVIYTTVDISVLKVR